MADWSSGAPADRDSPPTAPWTPLPPPKPLPDWDHLRPPAPAPPTTAPAPAPPPQAPQHVPPPAPPFPPAPPPMVMPRPPRKSRKGLAIALSAAAVVVAVVVGVVIAVTTGDNEPGTGAASPEEAVRGYLDALARGDADAALAYGRLPPASTELLTDDVLGKQIDTWPISDVKIVSTENVGGAMARVHVTAKFGDQVSDATLTTQDSDGWKLRQVALKIDNAVAANSMFKAMKTLTVFGEPADQPRYVFPGWVDVASTNANVSLKAQPMLLSQLAVEAGVPLSPTDLMLSEAGDRAVKKALSDALQACTDSNLLTPPGCPLRVDPTGLAEGTARWGSVNDLDAVQVIPNPLMLTASLIGTVTLPFSARTTAGAEVSTNLFGVLNGKADLAQNPPVVTWS